jgi:hypothetical protein
MLRHPTIDRLNGAIHACLDECYSASNPLAALASFVRRLRTNPAWREAEIEEVEQTVRRMLRALVVRHREDRLSPVSREPARTIS